MAKELMKGKFAHILVQAQMVRSLILVDLRGHLQGQISYLRFPQYPSYGDIFIAKTLRSAFNLDPNFSAFVDVFGCTIVYVTLVEPEMEATQLGKAQGKM